MAWQVLYIDPATSSAVSHTWSYHVQWVIDAWSYDRDLIGLNKVLDSSSSCYKVLCSETCDKRSDHVSFRDTCDMSAFTTMRSVPMWWGLGNWGRSWKNTKQWWEEECTSCEKHWRVLVERIEMMEHQLLVSSPASLRKLVKVEKVRTNTLAATTKGKNWKIFIYLLSLNSYYRGV